MENNFLATEKKFLQFKVIFYPFPKQIWTKIFVWDEKYLVQDNFNFVQDKNDSVQAEGRGNNILVPHQEVIDSNFPPHKGT